MLVATIQNRNEKEGITLTTSIEMQEQFLQLLSIMQCLRGENGCPWDKEQNYETLKRYLLEESYEVFAALDENDMSHVCEELGDVLLQVVFYAQMAKEDHYFDMGDVLKSINEKMIRRHPHVFGQEQAKNSKEVLAKWEFIKQKEGQKKKKIMEINPNLPALLLAQKAQEKAARVGFDWPNVQGAYDKLREELQELKNAQKKEEQEEELGDVFFSLINIARILDLDSENIVRKAANKFIRRFNDMEQNLEQNGQCWQDCNLADLDALWQQAKNKEKKQNERG